jgi:hypothetical protein
LDTTSEVHYPLSTNPAQALKGTSDQNLNAIKYEDNTPNLEADLLLNTQKYELVLPGRS